MQASFSDRGAADVFPLPLFESRPHPFCGDGPKPKLSCETGGSCGVGRNQALWKYATMPFGL